MCDIVAVRGRQAASDVLLRLGVLAHDGASVKTVTELGGDRSLQALTPIPPEAVSPERIARGGRSAPTGRLAIGQVRYVDRDRSAASHTHPLLDCEGRVAVVHCGILDNAADLRATLDHSGHRFESALDSEVIPHVIEDELSSGAAAFDAFQAAVQRLSGSWAIAALIARHNSIFIARYRSPLMVRGTVGRCVVASDPAATEGVRGPLRILEDGSIAELGTTWHWAGAPGRPPPPTTSGIGHEAAPQPNGWPSHRHNTLQHH